MPGPPLCFRFRLYNASHTRCDHRTGDEIMYLSLLLVSFCMRDHEYVHRASIAWQADPSHEPALPVIQPIPLHDVDPFALAASPPCSNPLQSSAPASHLCFISPHSCCAPKGTCVLHTQGGDQVLSCIQTKTRAQETECSCDP